MSNKEKMMEMMKNDPTLLEKLEAEIKRLSESGEKARWITGKRKS